jgi:NhaA family Na+:H+ antiporter
MHVESSSGIVLLLATVAALLLANSPAVDAFVGFWKTPVGFEFGAFGMRHSLQHWINDGLMAIFFFVIGLEVKREIVHGELGSLQDASLPIAAPLGGMLVPASIYLALQRSGPGASRTISGCIGQVQRAPGRPASSCAGGCDALTKRSGSSRKRDRQRSEQKW